MTDIHLKRLKEICRLCEVHIRVDGDKDRSYKALSFSKEIKEIYNIDVSAETDELYPTQICKSHARHLYRSRETKGESLVNSNELKKCKPTKIYYHHNHYATCGICQIKSHTGRPSKKP